VKPYQTIKLNYKQNGSGPVLIILHGLLGSLDNWETISRKLADKFTVIRLDLRNHGRSPHTEPFSISLMAADVIQFMIDHQLNEVQLAGHSMGGKVALEMLMQNESLLNRLMILDITPLKYPEGHANIFNGMLSLNLTQIHSRKDADAFLTKDIQEKGMRQFILKNLERKQDGSFKWKVNLQSIYKNYLSINEGINFDQPVHKTVLFVKAERSDYIRKGDEALIRKSLPEAKFTEVKNSGHWIHVDQPAVLLNLFDNFFLSK
jgi:pimeloyl-ACP methyl ester carboxylesterase